MKLNLISKRKIYILIENNQTGSNRLLTIGLQAGNYFNEIKITQLAN